MAITPVTLVCVCKDYASYCSSYLRYEADVDVAEVLFLHLKLKLPEGLNERHTLNVSHSPT